MIFSAEFTIPVNTTIYQPKRLVLPVSIGTVERVWVRWHWGSANLCGVRGLYRTFVHWPLAIGEWFYSSPYPLEFAESLVLDQDPVELVLEGYNNDDTYPHSVWVGFNIMRGGRSSDDAEWLRSLGSGG